jgi:hypothetical protein
MAATTVKFQTTRHMRRRNWLRTRRAKKYRAWASARATALATTGVGQTFTVTAAYVAATGVLTFTLNAADTETVTIGTTVYTFQTALVDSPNNVLIGATASDSLDNLIAAINAAAGAGTLYGTGTIAHPDVSAAAGAGDTMDVTALVTGEAANSIVTTEGLTNGSWGGGNLAGGVEGNTVDITTHGLATTDGPFTLTSATTLPAGLSATELYWAVVVDANRIKLATSLEAAQGKHPTDEVDITDAGTGIHTLARADDTAEAIFEWNRKHKSDTIQAATDIDSL